MSRYLIQKKFILLCFILNYFNVQPFFITTVILTYSNFKIIKNLQNLSSIFTTIFLINVLFIKNYLEDNFTNKKKQLKFSKIILIKLIISFVLFFYLIKQLC